MHPVLQNMMERRSIREYSDRQVDMDILNQILQAAYFSPNAGNRQTTRLVVGINNFLFSDADAYIMANNTCLAAKSFGVGSCIIYTLMDYFRNEYGKARLAEKPYEDIVLSENPYYAMRMAFIVGPCGELIEFVTELPNPNETE